MTGNLARVGVVGPERAQIASVVYDRSAQRNFCSADQATPWSADEELFRAPAGRRGAASADTS
jgi:hypothetical protein